MKSFATPFSLIALLPLWISLSLNLLLTKKAYAESPTFRLHLSVEPLSLNPSQQKGSGATFLMNTLQLPLFYSELDQRFKPGALQSCRWTSPLKLTCKLKEKLRWSNGRDLTAEDVKRTFIYFKNPDTKAVRADLVRNITDVKSNGNHEVIFELATPEPRFQERLTSPLLAPIYDTKFPAITQAATLVTSGPYQISEWQSKRKIVLKPNPYFLGGHPQRPVVEFYFIPEDTTALMLYEKGQLDFLRRLPTAYLSRYAGKPDFFQVPIVRFDYVGFGPSLAQQPELRKILSQSLQFDDWKKVLYALGRPGCFGIGLDLIQTDPCHSFNPTRLAEWRNLINKMNLPKLEIHYSTLGGEDNKRSMEWLQSEWKKNLGLNVSVKGLENALFQKEMIENPVSIYRFGVTLEHLSCHNAIENFLARPDRSLPFKNDVFLRMAEKLRQKGPTDSEEKLCQQALQLLLDDHWIIPLGRIHMTMLVKPEWKDWHLSALSYLDLSQLHWAK